MTVVRIVPSTSSRRNTLATPLRRGGGGCFQFRDGACWTKLGPQVEARSRRSTSGWVLSELAVGRFSMLASGCRENCDARRLQAWGCAVQCGKEVG